MVDKGASAVPTVCQSTTWSALGWPGNDDVCRISAVVHDLKSRAGALMRTSRSRISECARQRSQEKQEPNDDGENKIS